MKTLDEMAMEYTIAKLGVDPNRLEGLFDLSPKIPEVEWHTDYLLTEMHKRFSVYETQQAIKRAEEVVRMVIPK